MRTAPFLVLVLLGCGPRVEPLPEISCRADGVFLAEITRIWWVDTFEAWNYDDFGASTPHYVQMYPPAELSLRDQQTSRCDSFTGIEETPSSVLGLDPIFLDTTFNSKRFFYSPDTSRYHRDYGWPTDHEDPTFDAEDTLRVGDGDQVELTLPVPPDGSWRESDTVDEVLVERDGLDTPVRIPDDDFDALHVLVLSNWSEERQGYGDRVWCIYGRADFERRRGAWEHPILAPEDRDILPDEVLTEAHAKVQVTKVHLEMTDALWPGEHPVPVMAGKGISLSLADLQ